MRVLLVHHSPKNTGITTYVSNLYNELTSKNSIDVQLSDLTDKTGLGFVSSQSHKIRRVAEIANGLLRLPEGFDVYHLTSQVIAASRALVHPTIVTVHDAGGFLSSGSFLTQAFFRISFNFAKSAEMFICPSKFTREESIKQLGVTANKIRVIPLGVDHNRFRKRDRQECRERLNLPKNAKIILSVSSTLKHKNLPTLLKAFKIINEKEPNAKLIRVGAPNPTTPELEELAKRLGISEHIVKIRPSDEELSLFYSASDVFIHTSTYEGFGAPIAEAMSCGIPVITSNASSIPEIVGDGGIMIYPHDVEGFASEALRVLNDKGYSCALSDSGFTRSQIFTWKSCAEKTCALYQEVAKNNNRTSCEKRSVTQILSK